MVAPTPPPPPRVPAPRPRAIWDGWGDGTAPARLPAPVRAVVAAMLRGRPHPVPRLDRTRLALTPGRLTAGQQAALAAAVPGGVDTSEDARALHLGGKSTPDLLARRSSGPQRAPDAVLLPRSHEEVRAALAVCVRERIAVVPFGGGTSVVGGVDPAAPGFEAVVALDLARTAALRRLDEVSLLATFGAGTTGPQAEELLAERGYTLGHFPQSFEFATLGGYAATRSSGQASRGYGRFDDLVHALRVAAPAGDLDLGRAPASAAGPDLRELFLGSEGAFGVITEVTVRIRPVPAVTLRGAWSFPDFTAGAAALRTLTQAGIRPAVIRLSDETETRVNAAMGGHVTRLRGALAVVTAEGADAAEAEGVLAAVAEAADAHGGRARGADPALSWERGRFAAPALRDALLEMGVLAETLETATTWANLADLKRAVTAALTETLTARGTPPVILCHISHVYPAGASLYFTVVAAGAPDARDQWHAAKAAASRAIVAAGGTISHHHAVGRDHLPYLEAEIGPVGVQVLRAVKAALDPTGILNPGVLVP